MPYASALAVEQPDARISSQLASQSAPQQLLAPDQLNNLIAPIALYPDELLGQMLAASTYPLEIVEAQQWLQQNGNLRGRALIDAARQQDWDPSVQMLVAFPDAVALLTRDIRWTTDLGNAFLAQQADVMNAIQALRAQARDNGRLATTPQQVVSTEAQNGQSAIAIQPANPQVIYVPVYDPAYVWGASAGGAYGFGPGIDIAGLFSGLVSWGGWGWGLGWFTHTLSLASLFFNMLGYHNFGGGFNAAGGVGALAVWAHNPAHRLGVPYSNGIVATRYHGASLSSARASASRSVASASRPSGFLASGRSASDGWQHFGSSTARAGAPAYRPGFASNSVASPQINSSQTNRGYASAGFERMAPGFQSASSSRQFSSQSSSHQDFAPQQRFSAPRASSPHFSSPHVSSPHISAPRGSSHFSAPHHSGGGHSGKSSRKH